ncbi:hypothetical protein [Oscillatoria acuminata]|uniref:Nucleic acid-binding protein, contains PIN domain n=1 Tax=Oscillatoria acuminata PCC 6304 TaxID=56110 RepID=K9TGL4_9CYAN|nr:hypothetical protein [Oscillatoria acuminata]AFY81543.1 hypothetical protein Oscil6304_1870 [Oscillatoria acuminata PCC 6304]
MLSRNGTILDATALIDFRYLDEWEWLQRHYQPLYIAQEVLDSDHLEQSTQETAKKYLIPLSLETEEMFASFLEFGNKAPLLSEADRSTLVLARHQLLLCASDDNLVVKICQEYGIAYIRTLRLLTEMVQTGHKSKIEVKKMADLLIQERGKHIRSSILTNWYNELGK